MKTIPAIQIASIHAEKGAERSKEISFAYSAWIVTGPNAEQLSSGLTDPFKRVPRDRQVDLNYWITTPVDVDDGSFVVIEITALEMDGDPESSGSVEGGIQSIFSYIPSSILTKAGPDIVRMISAHRRKPELLGQHRFIVDSSGILTERGPKPSIKLLQSFSGPTLAITIGVSQQEPLSSEP